MLRAKVAIDQDRKLIPLHKPIIVFVGIRENLAEAELDLAAPVFTIVFYDSESIVQEIQVLCSQVHNILFHRHIIKLIKIITRLPL